MVGLRDPMLARFSAYGFLKNQRYFEPFLVLAFLDKGLSFAEIGSLVAVREFVTNILEIPSGAVADTWGRRRALVLSFSAYSASFLTFAFGTHVLLLALGMALYGFGDAFRSGTHKAMIMTWLEAQGRTGDKTTVYGYTRSWSKLGSAVSVMIAVGLLVAAGGYRVLFLAPLIPYALDLVNVASYPAYLEGTVSGRFDVRAAARHFWATLTASWRNRRLRRILFESSGFQGYVKAVKDYLQPAAKALSGSLGLASPSALCGVAVVVGPIYLLQSLLEALASRKAGAVAQRAGGEVRASRILWGGLAVLALVLTVGGLASWAWLLVLGLVGLVILQNLWRPVLVARISSEAPTEQAATVLSLDSQVRSFATMILAPLLGVLVDMATARTPSAGFLPLGLVGLSVAALFAWGGRADAERGPSGAGSSQREG